MNRIFLLLVLLLSVVSCKSIGLQNEGSELTTPTTHPLFIVDLTDTAEENSGNSENGTPEPEGDVENQEQPTSLPLSPLPTPRVTRDLTEKSIVIVPVYGDSLDEEWRLFKVDEIDLNPSYTNLAHGGSSSISILAPSRDGRILFTLNDSSEESYRWEDVTGLSFWIRSDNNQVPSSTISIGVLGSDESTYWSTEDRLTLSRSNLPIEANLLAWRIERPIPPNGWMEVTVELDVLMQNESFEWFTGFYLRSETGPSEAIYIDDVNLIVLSDNE